VRVGPGTVVGTAARLTLITTTNTTTAATKTSTTSTSTATFAVTAVCATAVVLVLVRVLRQTPLEIFNHQLAISGSQPQPRVLALQLPNFILEADHFGLERFHQIGRELFQARLPLPLLRLHFSCRWILLLQRLRQHIWCTSGGDSVACIPICICICIRCCCICCCCGGG